MVESEIVEGEGVEAERWALRSPGSRDDSPRPMLPRGVADIEFTVTMETGPEAMTFVRFIPYSRGYVINAVPSSFALSCFSISASSSSRSSAYRLISLFILIRIITKDLLLDGFTNLVITSSRSLLITRDRQVLSRENYRKIGWFVEWHRV